MEPTSSPFFQVVPAKRGSGLAALDAAEATARELPPVQASRPLTPEESIRRFRKPNWTPPPAQGLSRITGDMSMAISPQEYQQWYTNPGRGYGGPEHQQFIETIHGALDIPAIPVGKGEDLTIREYMTQIPYMVQSAAYAKARQTGKPEDRAAARAILDINRQYGTISFATGERKDAPFVHPIVADVYAELTGQRYDRGNPWGVQGADMIRTALQAGTRGGELADDNSTSQSQYDQWKAQYGDEADRMLPPGAEKNAMRQRLLELTSTMSDNPQFAPTNYTSIDVAANMLANPGGYDESGRQLAGNPLSQRLEELTDPSAPRGRMKMRLEAWKAGEKPEGEKPYVVQGGAFQQYDPNSFLGMRNQLGNPAFTQLGKAQASWYPVFGDLVMQGGLGMDANARDFVGQTYANQMRPSPIRPDDQTPEQAKETEQWWDTYQGVKRDYFSPRVGPPMSAALDTTARAFGNRGIGRSYLSPAMSDLFNLPSDTAESMYQSAAVAAPAVFAMAGKPIGAALKAAGATLADEPIENAYMTPLLSGETTGYLQPAQSSPWMRAYAGRDVDPNNVEEHTKALLEADNEFKRQNAVEFSKWQNSQYRKPYATAYPQ